MVEILYNGDGSGDWVVVRKDGKLYSMGHSLSLHDVVSLLQDCGVQVSPSLNLSDEELLNHE